MKGLVVAVPDALQANAGDVFRFEVFGAGAVAVFEARLEAASGAFAVFSMRTSMRVLPSDEAMRVRTREATIRLFQMASSIVPTGIEELDLLQAEVSQTPVCEGIVLDVSAQGIGLRSSHEVRRGEYVRFQIDTPFGRAEGQGEVRYCKPEGQQYRIGIAIDSMDRLNRGMFERLLRNEAAA